MPDKLQGGIRVGSTSVSIPVQLFASATGLPLTGKVAANLSGYYYRQGAAAAVALSFSDLAALNSAFSAGGVKEVANVAGHYRFDAPDLAFAAGAAWVTFQIGTSDSQKFTITFELSATALTNETWTDAKAAFVDQSISAKSAATLAAADVTGNLPADAKAWNGGSLPTIGDATAANQTSILSALGAIAGYIDTEISTLLTELAKVPKSDATVSWNATAIASIKTALEISGSHLALIKQVTDQVRFTVPNQVDANALTGGGGGGTGEADWTAYEKKQIRDALGVDGDKEIAIDGQLQGMATKFNILTSTMVPITTLISTSIDLRMVRGDSRIFTFTDDVFEEAGLSIWFTAKKSYKDSDELSVFQKTELDGIEVDPVNKVATVNIDPEDTEELEDRASELHWDLQIEKEGLVRTVSRGILRVFPDVTLSRQLST